MSKIINRTSRLDLKCTNQNSCLEYTGQEHFNSICVVGKNKKSEPITDWKQVRITMFWWTITDSNR